MLARKNKRYAVSIDNLPDLRGRTAPVRLQLPAPPFQRVGQQRRFTIWIGDDLDSSREDDLLEATRLRLTFEGFHTPEDAVRVRLNGDLITPEPDPWRRSGIMIHQAPVKQGMNEIVLQLEKRDPNADRPLEIRGIEVLINYRQ